MLVLFCKQRINLCFFWYSYIYFFFFFFFFGILLNVGWSVSLNSWCCFVNGCVVVYDTLETTKTASLGFDETNIFGNLHICDRYIAMATAHHRYYRRHFMWHSINNNNGTIPKHNNKIWKKGKSMYIIVFLSLSLSTSPHHFRLNGTRNSC